MGLFDFLKRKKKKDGTVPGTDPDVPASLDDVDLSGFEPPETRYTQEYQEFLEEQEAAEECASDAEADGADGGE